MELKLEDILPETFAQFPFVCKYIKRNPQPGWCIIKKIDFVK